MMNKIPVILVTGFLGSGKTTFLKSLAKNHPEWRIVFLVNEFAEFSVDGTILNESGTPTQSVVGGSLFCHCKASDFVRIMRTEVLDIHNEQKLHAVVIETSGIADPDAIGNLMKNHGLSEHFDVHRIVTITAPGKLKKMIGNLPVVEAQIRSSDLILLNKTDLFEEQVIQEAGQIVADINAQAEIIRTSYCECDFDLGNRFLALPEGELTKCDANPFTTESFDLGVQNFEKLEAWLHQLPETILRVKGYVETDRGWFKIERTTDSTEIEPSKAIEGAQLVLIVADENEKEIQVAVEKLAEVKTLS